MSPQRWKGHRTCANHHFRLEKPNWFEGFRLLESVRQNEVGKHSNFCTTLGMVKKKFSIFSPHKHILREAPPLLFHRRENKELSGVKWNIPSPVQWMLCWQKMYFLLTAAKDFSLVSFCVPKTVDHYRELTSILFSTYADFIYSINDILKHYFWASVLMTTYLGLRREERFWLGKVSCIEITLRKVGFQCDIKYSVFNMLMSELTLM